ncbi:hypothetical protein JCM17092_06950 [Haloplanus litoreus]
MPPHRQPSDVEVAVERVGPVGVFAVAEDPDEHSGAEVDQHDADGRLEETDGRVGETKSEQEQAEAERGDGKRVADPPRRADEHRPRGRSVLAVDERRYRGEVIRFEGVPRAESTPGDGGGDE